jgi:hypothetical protein
VGLESLCCGKRAFEDAALDLFDLARSRKTREMMGYLLNQKNVGGWLGSMGAPQRNFTQLG